MEEQRRNIDETFRQSLFDYREAPPGAVWQDIASRLDKEDGSRRGFFFRRPWIVLSLLLIAGSTWMVVGLNRRGENKLSVSDQNGKINTVAINTVEAAVPPMNIPPEANTLNSDAATPEKIESEKPAQSVTDRQSAPKMRISEHLAASPRLSPVKSVIAAKITPIAAVAPALASHSPEAPKVPAPEKATVAKLSASTSHPVGTETSVPGSWPEWDESRLTPAKQSPVNHPLAVRSDLVQSPPLAVSETKLPVKDIVPPTPNQNWVKPLDEHIKPLAASKASALHQEAILKPDVSYVENLPVAVLASPDGARDTVVETIAIIPQTKPAVVASAKAPEEKPVTERSGASGPTDSASQPENTADMKTPGTRSLFKLPVSLAVLAGYEHGFNTPVTSRYTACLRLLWQANRTVAIGLQPAFRFGNLGVGPAGNDMMYQRSTIRVDSFHTADNSPSVRWVVDSIYNYVIREQLDSITVKAGTAGGSFWELELPLVVQYKLNRNWHVYGGPSLNFGGKISYSNAGEQHVTSIYRKDSIAQSQQLPMISFNNYFGRSSLPPYSSHKATDPQNPASVRVGYVLGVGYSLKRFTTDLCVSQQLSGYNSLPDAQKQAFSTPYVRVSVGYLLISSKERHHLPEKNSIAY